MNYDNIELSHLAERIRLLRQCIDEAVALPEVPRHALVGKAETIANGDIRAARLAASFSPLLDRDIKTMLKLSRDRRLREELLHE